jgi:hypothetical protein
MFHACMSPCLCCGPPLHGERAVGAAGQARACRNPRPPPPRANRFSPTAAGPAGTRARHPVVRPAREWKGERHPARWWPRTRLAGWLSPGRLHTPPALGSCLHYFLAVAAASRVLAWASASCDCASWSPRRFPASGPLRHTALPPADAAGACAGLREQSHLFQHLSLVADQQVRLVTQLSCAEPGATRQMGRGQMGRGAGRRGSSTGVSRLSRWPHQSDQMALSKRSDGPIKAIRWPYQSDQVAPSKRSDGPIKAIRWPYQSAIAPHHDAACVPRRWMGDGEKLVRALFEVCREPQAPALARQAVPDSRVVTPCQGCPPGPDQSQELAPAPL